MSAQPSPDAAPPDPGPPGLRADARRNRARVLQAAQAAFAADGLSVPLDEIARRAGVGAGTVYRHFPTKEALFETIVLGQINQLCERIRHWVDAPDPGVAFFSMWDEVAAQGALKKDMTDALTAAGVDISAAVARARGTVRETVGTVLARAQAVGAVRPDVTPADLYSLLSGVFVAARQDGAGPIETALAVIADGLRARPAGGPAATGR